MFELSQIVKLHKAKEQLCVALSLIGEQRQKSSLCNPKAGADIYAWLISQRGGKIDSGSSIISFKYLI